MKLLLGLCILVGAYFYFMVHTTDLVTTQATNIQAVYQRVGHTDPEVLATGRPADAAN